MYFNDRPISTDGLRNELRAAKASARDVSLVITADEFAYHGQVVSVIDAAKLEGVTKFAINVERSK
jgi:biopolymer transport protein ExbD